MTASCTTPPQPLDIQGHRGARGHFPENTLPAFEGAIAMGVTTLELDVVISRDSQVVVSHEPWLNATICTDTNGQEVDPLAERPVNLYQLDYADIARCDCGSLAHPRFPEQKRMVAHKPLLRDVFAATASATGGMGQPIRYNIEIKAEPQDYGVFHPDAATFSRLVYAEVEKAGLQDRSTLQSFDLDILKALHAAYPAQTLALLVDEEEDYVKKFAALGFDTPILSPWHKLVDARMVQFCIERKMQLIPWTVNEVADMQRLIALGVAGIISDYPDRLVALVKD
jgi:glycerophosphoryl diester phosphodiesterase